MPLGFALIPPCADPVVRPSQLRLLGGRRPGLEGPRPIRRRRARPPSPSEADRSADNPFAPRARRAAFNPFLDADDDEVDNPFLPRREPVRPDGRAPTRRASSPCCRAGSGCSGATPRSCSPTTNPSPTRSSGRCRPTRAHSACASCIRSCPTRRCRPSSPASRRRRCPPERARDALIEAICDDLGRRGFSAVEAYPEVGARPTRRAPPRRRSGSPSGSGSAVADERFPVFRRELE